ncbi:ABC transporter permease [Patescibacteria group bacterium]|nr:ABC transporter permease [Patescibacteria group bacterium]
MKFKEYISLAIFSFSRQLTRTMLTGLGIVISIAAVIVVISAAQGVKGFIIGQFETYGTNILNVEVKVPETAKNSSEGANAQAFGTVIKTLTLDDMKALRKLPNIKNNYAGQMGQAVANSGSAKKTITLFGVSPTFLEIDTSKVAQGRFFSPEEDDSLAKVAVLGFNVASELFGDSNPIGQDIKIKQKNFEVIGVFESKGAVMFVNYDDFVYLPIRTLQKQILGIDHVSYILNQYQDENKLPQTVAAVEDLLRDRHNIDDSNPDKDDFQVQSNDDFVNILDTVIGGFTILLIILAAISLIVGGVGIMNIMYVSVLERTFEIGLRKAIGARPKQILLQFLTEAVLITTLGGLSGILAGVAVSYLISLVAAWQGFAWDFVVPLYSVVLATSFSVVCGLVFGLYPARQAAALDPIEALRRE